MVRAPGQEPLFDIDPRTGASIEVFYTDRALETFGRCGAGWFWCHRRRGYPAMGQAVGPFATSYAAYRDALLSSSTTPPDAAGVGHLTYKMRLAVSMRY